MGLVFESRENATRSFSIIENKLQGDPPAVLPPRSSILSRVFAPRPSSLVPRLLGEGSRGRKSVTHTACACATLFDFTRYRIFSAHGRYTKMSQSTALHDIEHSSTVACYYRVRERMNLDRSVSRTSERRQTTIQLSLTLFANIVGKTIVHAHRNI